MIFSISIIIKLKNRQNHFFLETIINEAAENCNKINLFKDHEIEGINKHIKKNNIIIIIEFEMQNDLINFINFIKTLKELEIESIYVNNTILFATEKYLNSVNTMLHDKKELKKTITKNQEQEQYKDLYNNLFNV